MLHLPKGTKRVKILQANQVSYRTEIIQNTNAKSGCLPSGCSLSTDSVTVY